MKRYGIFLTAALIFILAGCNSGDGKKGREPDRQETVAMEENTEEGNTEEQVETGSDEEKADALLFAEKVVSAVQERDLDALISLSSFPVYISSVETNNGVVESIEEFAELEPALIFTDGFVEAIASYDLKEIKKIKAGYVLGDGKPNVIFTDKDGAFVITDINIE